MPLVECSRSFVHVNTAPSTALIRRRPAENEANVLRPDVHEVFKARPVALRKLTLKQLHSSYNFDSATGKWAPRRFPAVVTFSPRFSRKPSAGGPDFEDFCRQYFQVNTAYGAGSEDLPELDALLQRDPVTGVLESWASAFARLHPTELERLRLAEEAAKAHYAEDAAEADVDGFGPDVDSDASVAWWREVGAGQPDNVGRVLDGASAAAVLREFDTERKRWVRPEAVAAPVTAYESLHVRQ